jgi:hypothetical protein
VDWVIYRETLTGWKLPEGIAPMNDSEKEIELRRISESLSVLSMPNRLE